jgi:hypothetical protein
VQFISRPGSVYQIAVVSEPNPGDFSPVTLRLSSVTAPENDAFENRTRLIGPHHALTADLELATRTPGEPAKRPSPWPAFIG